MKIVVVGGGSASWTPILMQSFLLNNAFRGAEICLMDINAAALDKSLRLCRMYAEKAPEQALKLNAQLDLDTALRGANYVIVAIAHGGLEAELADHRIARKYGFYNIKGSEVGIAGASRTLRHVPELVRIARRMRDICPDVRMINVTNPLTSITRAVTKYAGVDAVGLCHGVVNHLAAILPLLGANSIQDVDFTVAGVDHNSWFLSAKINGRDAFKKLRDDGWVERAHKDESIGAFDDPFAGRENQRLRFLLWDTFGYMPAISDEHCVEFFGQMILTHERRAHFGMTYDRIADRQNSVERAKHAADARLNGDTEINIAPVGEIADKVIAALEGFGAYTDIMNYQNVGQVENLPMGTVVETRVYVDSCGFHPVHAGSLPKQIALNVQPTALREELFMEAAMERDIGKLRAALVMDPLVFDFRNIDAICNELMEYNAQFIR